MEVTDGNDGVLAAASICYHRGRHRCDTVIHACLQPTRGLCLETDVTFCVCPPGARLRPQHIAKDCCCGLYFDRGGDPDQADDDNFTALHFACNAGHRDVVKALIEHRANVNARSRFQSTPLHFACEHGFVEIVRLLLGNGATVDAQNSDLATPLHFACQKGHIEAAQVMVEASARVDPRTNRGNSPLHYACFFGRYPVVRMLITNGADIGLRNDSGARPGEQFSSKVTSETRASLGRLLRNRSLSPASRATATKGDGDLEPEAGETSAREVAELPGFKDNYLSGEGSDGNRRGHRDVVALSQQRADKASRKKPSRPEDNKECRC